MKPAVELWSLDCGFKAHFLLLNSLYSMILVKVIEEEGEAARENINDSYDNKLLTTGKRGEASR